MFRFRNRDFLCAFSGPFSVGIEKYSRFRNFRLWESIGTSPNATCTLVNKALLRGY